jgi:hypothetical protein
MLFRIFAAALIIAAGSVLSPALSPRSDDPKPACNAETAGRWWPEGANQDPALRKKMARCGELQICARGHWRYRWEPLTVRLDQLRGGESLPKPAGCEADQSNQPSRSISSPR